MIDPVGAHALGEHAVLLLAESDPLRAMAVLARALKMQARGGRAAAVRVLIDRIADYDPNIVEDIAAKLAARQGA